MDATLTLYILAGGVALAVLLFIVMGIVTVLRGPRLPDVASLAPPPPRPFAGAFTPHVPLPAGIIALQPMPATGRHALTNDHSAPRTVIPLPAIAGIAPATRAQSSPGVAAAAHLAASPLVAAHAAHAAHAANAAHAAHAEPFAAAPHVAARAAPSAAPPQVNASSAAHGAADDVTGSVRAAHARVRAEPLAAHPAPPPLVWSAPVLRPTPMPMSTRIPVALPSLVAPPVAPARMPRATMQPIAPAAPARMPRTTMQPIAPSAPARMPRTTMQPIASGSNGDWSTEPQVAVVRRGDTTMPIFRQRPSLLRTVIGWTIATLLVAASPAVVEPSLLDPLCDDYEWDGAEAAAIVRDYARESNIAIDLDPFAITKVDAGPAPSP